jgi:hypothetical protein
VYPLPCGRSLDLTTTNERETMNEREKRHAIADQFATEWLLVAMNDYDTYRELMEEAEEGNTIALADKLREEWETLAEQVTELVAEKISPTASLFIGQWLQGQGQLPFDLIAREVVRKNEEVNA